MPTDSPTPPDVLSLLALLQRGEQSPDGLSDGQRAAFDYCRTREPELATLGFRTPAGIKRIRKGTPRTVALLAGAYGGLRIFITDEGEAVLADAHFVDDRVRDQSIALSGDENIILKWLAGHQKSLISLYEIETSTRISRKTAGMKLNHLIELGLAVRPNGPNGGATITPKGISFIATTQ